MQQLLWLETLLKGSAGLLLVLAPLATIKLFGLPRTDSGFWPRVAGTLLVGLAGALFLEGAMAGAHGLGLAGCIVVNLFGAAVLASSLLVDAGPPSARGRALTWTVVLILVVLSILEIANL